MGLGATFAIGFGLFSGLAESSGAGPALLTGVLMTGSGALEGLVVGVAQWAVLRRKLPDLPPRAWALASVAGALAAWFLGSIPMTLASLSAPASGQPMPEPPAGLVLLMAGGMGLVAGLVLSLVQWRVLRRHVAEAWAWLPANSIAWAVGMPIVFAAIDIAGRTGSIAGGVAVMAAGLVVTGAAVGAMHGLALVRFVPRSNGDAVQRGVATDAAEAAR